MWGFCHCPRERTLHHSHDLQLAVCNNQYMHDSHLLSTTWWPDSLGVLKYSYLWPSSIHASPRQVHYHSQPLQHGGILMEKNSLTTCFMWTFTNGYINTLPLESKHHSFSETQLWWKFNMHKMHKLANVTRPISHQMSPLFSWQLTWQLVAAEWSLSIYAARTAG